MLGAKYAKWDSGRNPARETRPRFRTKKNSLILGGTKRAADLGRNGPRTLDLDEKKQPISGGTFREWDLGPKLKIHVFDGFCKINSGSFNPDLGRKKISLSQPQDALCS